MIIGLGLKIIAMTLSGIFFLLPKVAMPEGVINALTNMVQYYNSFLDIFPFAVLPTQLFFVIIAFEIALVVGKFFFGNRLPVNFN